MKLRVCALFFLILGYNPGLSSLTPRPGTHAPTTNRITIQNSPTTEKEEKPELAEWTILVKMLATGNLEPFSALTLAGLAEIGSTEKINILVEIQREGTSALRCKIAQGGYYLEDIKELTTSGNQTEECIDAHRWAFTNYPAKRYGSFWWSHGSGVYNPLAYMNQPYYAQVNNSRYAQRAIAPERGLFFDDSRSIYMKNSDIATALKKISSECLQGKKLDFLCMDSCYMAMLEVCYEMKEHVEYVISSEEYVIATGHPYNRFVEGLTKNPAMTGAEVGTMLVSNFSTHFNSRTTNYTQSSIKLVELDTLRNRLDHFVDTYEQCKEFDPHTLQLLLKRARNQAHSFAIKDYVDIGSFFAELNGLISKHREALENVPHRHISALQDAIRDIHYTLSRAVSAHAAGSAAIRSSGLSIYFPLDETIFSNYYDEHTFLQESRWLSFITNFSSNTTPPRRF